VCSKRGDYTPTYVHENETKATTTHNSTRATLVAVDYATAVVDPLDDMTVWMVHEFASKARGGYKTVGGVDSPERSTWD
jgi:hypothetical protein